MYRVINVVICYNNGEEVIQYIDGMKNHEQIEKVCFVVVINGARDCDYKIINDYLSSGERNLVVFDPHKNLGYLNGLIKGYDFYRRNNDAPDYVVMSNTDISIPDIKYYSKLLEKKYENFVACIGPSVFIPEKNTYDNPVEDERRSLQQMNRILIKFSIPIFRGLYVYLSKIKGFIIRKPKTDSRFVYEVHGCYFILTKRFAELLRKKEYGVFMYSEETYIAEMALQNGMRNYYDSDIEINHNEHSTTKFVKCSKIAKYIKESMSYIKDTFY